MRVLLDTHVAIWAVTGDPRLPDTIVGLLSAVTTEIAVSAVSLAEIAIKWPSSRLRQGGLPFGADEAVDLFTNSGFDFLDFNFAHAIALQDLPSIHRDPFDRMLICQALEEPMRLVTHDTVVASYDHSIIHF